MENKSGPTLNHTYNVLLATWNKDSGPDTKPECEECGEDMTGQKVFSTRLMWVCEKCRDKVLEDEAVYDDDYREDFHSDV
jgi:ribosomal protein L37AE/L43A